MILLVLLLIKHGKSLKIDEPFSELDKHGIRYEKFNPVKQETIRIDPFSADGKFTVEEEVQDEEKVDPEIKMLTDYITKMRSQSKMKKMIEKAYASAFADYKNKFINIFLDEEDTKNKYKKLAKKNQNLKHFSSPIHSKYNMNNAPKLNEIPCPRNMNANQCKQMRIRKYRQYKSKVNRLRCPPGMTKVSCTKHLAPQIRRLRLELIGAG